MRDAQLRPLPCEIPVEIRRRGEDPHEGLAVRLWPEGAAIDMGAGALSDPRVGETLVLVFRGGARFEATLDRLFERGFVARFSVGVTRRERLRRIVEAAAESGETLTEIEPDRRLAERLTGLRVEATCTTPRGEAPCRIVDFSLTGAAIETDAPLAVGEAVRIGQSAGRIVRADARVYGVEFDSAGEALARRRGLSEPMLPAPRSALGA